MPNDARDRFDAAVEDKLDSIRSDGLYKTERILDRVSPEVVCEDGIRRINLCANNYLGLSGSEDLVESDGHHPRQLDRKQNRAYHGEPTRLR